MGRMPYHIHVFPYRMAKDAVEYAIFQRSDLPEIWQGIAGGGEQGESIVQSALRECAEEGRILNPGPLYALDSLSYMRSTVFPEWTPVWGPRVIVLPMYFFGMPYDGEISISEEHLQFAWLDYERANQAVKMQDQNVALWELNERIKRNEIKRSLPPQMQQPWRVYFE